MSDDGMTEMDLDMANDTIDRLREENERLRARILKYRARLEVDHHYECRDGEMVLVYLPFEEDAPIDGIECRDETIKLLERDAMRWRALRQMKAVNTDRLRPRDWDEMADKMIRGVRSQ